VDKEGLSNEGPSSCPVLAYQRGHDLPCRSKRSWRRWACQRNFDGVHTNTNPRARTAPIATVIHGWVIGLSCKGWRGVTVDSVGVGEELTDSVAEGLRGPVGVQERAGGSSEGGVSVPGLPGVLVSLWVIVTVTVGIAVAVWEVGAAAVDVLVMVEVGLGVEVDDGTDGTVAAAVTV